MEAFLEPMLGQNGPLIFTQLCFWTFLCVLKSMWISSNFWYPLEGVFFKGKRESSIGVAENGPPETPFWPQEAPYWIPVGGQQGLQNQLQHNKMNFWPSKNLFEMMPQKGPHFEALKTGPILRTDSDGNRPPTSLLRSRGVCFAYYECQRRSANNNHLQRMEKRFPSKKSRKNGLKKRSWKIWK